MSFEKFIESKLDKFTQEKEAALLKSRDARN